MVRRKKGNPVHGWVVLDKPVGMTSTQAVGAVRRLFEAQKAGHAGTLDPLATGILPIALGEATKTVPFAVDGEKAYRFTVRFGVETDTDDAEGAGRAHIGGAAVGRRISRTSSPTSPARSARCRRASRRSRWMATAPMTLPAAARRSCSSRAGSWSMSCGSWKCPTKRRPYWKPSAARARTCAPSPATWAGSWAAPRTSLL